MGNSKERIGKGISRIAYLDNYTVVDIETTGLSSDYCDIIEISALKVRDSVVVDEFSSLVREKDAYVDAFIEDLTGITQEMVDNAPSIESVLIDFKDFIGDDIIVGQNISFDINFLFDRYERYFCEPLENDHVDIARFSRKLFKEEKSHTLQLIAERFNISYEGAHRALIDCKIEKEAYECLLNKARETYTEEEFINLFKRHREGRQKLKASDITADSSEFDEDHPLYNQIVVFTGTLDKMQRAAAYKLVVNVGGIAADRITKETNYLVLGNNDYCKSIKDGKSSKFKKAEEYKKKGLNIEIIDESTFYDLIEGNNND